MYRDDELSEGEEELGGDADVYESQERRMYEERRTGQKMNMQEECKKHWEYVKEVIRQTRALEEVNFKITVTFEAFLDYVGHHYQTAMMHGYNHGYEDGYETGYMEGVIDGSEK